MEHKILIEVIFSRSRHFHIFNFFFKHFFRSKFFPTQGKPFDFALRITNTGTNVFPGADINKISIKGNAVENISHSIDKTFSIPSLNPSSQTEIYIHRMTTLLEGLVWFSCDITPLNSKDTVLAFQRDIGTKQVIDPQKNYWGQETLVLSESQVAAYRLNRLVALLAGLTFLEVGVFG